ncbi:hypothetical protein ACLOJK_010845 [Asimina triloba]
MGERANEISNAKLLDWISSKFDGVTRQHLEGAGAASVVVVLTGFVAAYMWKKRRDRNASRMSSGTSRRAQILGALRGGRLAIKRILDTRHPSEAVAATAEEKLTKLLKKEDLLNFLKLQNTVAKLEMSRKEEEGLKLLREAHERAEKKGRLQEAYELDMLIVEMLIYKVLLIVISHFRSMSPYSHGLIIRIDIGLQGDYEGALKRKCLAEEEISDARRPLYKTIIQLILGQEEAKQSWLKYQDLRGRWRLEDSVPDASDHPPAQDFQMFKKTVKFLKEEIKKCAREEGK